MAPDIPMRLIDGTHVDSVTGVRLTVGLTPGLTVDLTVGIAGGIAVGIAVGIAAAGHDLTPIDVWTNHAVDKI